MLCLIKGYLESIDLDPTPGEEKCSAWKYRYMKWYVREEIEISLKVEKSVS